MDGDQNSLYIVNLSDLELRRCHHRLWHRVGPEVEPGEGENYAHKNDGASRSPLANQSS